MNKNIDALKLRNLLEKIDSGLDSPQKICLIGSAATILMGQPGRKTEDVDVWAPASIIREQNLKRAVEGAGLEFNPTDEEVELPYVQIIHPGIVQVPGYDPETEQWGDKPSRTLWSGRNLTVTSPPPEFIVASKMYRFSDADMNDAIWLMASQKVVAEEVLRCIKAMPASRHENSIENLDLLRHFRP